MIPLQRQNRILQLLEKKIVMSYLDLEKELNVSHMTVRRDVSKLEKEGKIKSVLGGVVLVNTIIEEPSHTVKLTLFHEQKIELGKTAVRHIPELSKIIYLDAGTTCLEIAHNLAPRDDLMFITNDFEITQYLISNTKSQIIHIGGNVNVKNHSTVGNMASDMLEKINIDLAFISSSSWSLKGLSTPDSDKVPVKKAIIKVSAINILVSDSSKFGKNAPYFIYPLDVFDKIITDNGIPAEAVKEIEKKEIPIIY